jgi:hypothetical protein
VVAVPVACALTRRCRITPGTGFALAVVAGLFLATPWAFKGTYFLDIRFAIMLGFLLFGAVLPHALPRSVMLALIAGFALLFATRIAVVCLAWDDHRQDLAALRSTIAEVEPGTRVFVASVAPEEAPQYWRDGPISRVLSNGIRVDYHAPALLLIEHRAFWPFLFDNPSQQPMTTLEPYRTLAAQAGSVPDHTAIAEAGKVDLCGYDDLLLLEAGGEPDLTHFAADRLTLLARSDFAALFRIKGATCGSASPRENRQSPPLARGNTDRSDWPTPP